RFYEIVVLLKALNDGYQSTARGKSNDMPHGTGEDSDELLFHNFVSRLGQICDSRPRGSTVTAFVVLQHPDKVEYVFGSNRRTHVELETTRGYISAILTSLRESLECEDDNQRVEYLSKLLRDVLIFNRERIRSYLNSLTEALEACIANCETGNSLNVASQQKILVQILELVRYANQSNDDDESLNYTEELIDALQSLQKPVTALFLRKRASDDKGGNTGPWRDLQHSSSRLLAYRRAVEVLWEASSMWPSLFDNFEITCISSSDRALNPLDASPQTASEILTRMIPKSAETKGKYLELAKTMQQNFDLDEVIQEMWTRNSFRPIVHAEILVHSWLEKTGGTKPKRFFQNWRYIGCSKPVCKLCHSYFSAHPSGIQTRGTHGNLYLNWRLPDHADVYGLRTKEEALLKRHEILQSIMGHLRQCVQRALSEKVTDSRPCDSNTISTFARNHGNFGMGARLNSLKLAQSQPWTFNEDWETMDGESETDDGVRRPPESEASSEAN
ncbi:hypothetical protein N431DRAFT_357886, partial [Stipitochalara longipes BDJ]